MFGDYIDILFAGIATIFAVKAFLDYRRNGGKLTVAARTWRRMAVIFGFISLYLLYTLRLGA
jgi:hypothetical protein